MDGDSVDSVVPIGRPVRRNHPYRSQGAVGESHRADTSFLCVLVEILLAILGPFDLCCGCVHTCRFFKLQQNDIGSFEYGRHGFESAEEAIAGKFLQQKIKLHLQITNRLLRSLGIGQQGLFATPISPLSQTISGAVSNEVGIASLVHQFGVLGISHTKLSFIGVLEIIRAQARLGIEIAHQASSTIIGKTL